MRFKLLPLGNNNQSAMKNKEIVPGKGLGELKFGMSRDEVLSVLGKPDDVDTYDDDEIEDEGSESWHYDDLEISLSFDEEEDWVLTTIAVSNPSHTFMGHELIGLTKSELLAVLESLEINNLDIEDWSSEEVPNHLLISSNDLQVNFWLEDEIVSEIQWGAFVEDDDDDEE